MSAVDSHRLIEEPLQITIVEHAVVILGPDGISVSITADALRKGDHFLIADSNAVAFDANAGWKEGDMIPDYVISRKESKGSAADNNAIASWKDGMWTVVIVRPLGLANSDDKALREGGIYNVGFAVHDDNITTRGHHVSFVRTLGFGTAADIKAVKVP